ncbi:hypothetical protein CONCODRAFT_19883 [Conidiobolus coronatus NRRL 28638]|uniref:SCP domain-containing protein n=1 Tax=Conidiobolus coronatus (strain ATCC 28846 / CBS 209.66 / NRRL 28638) TaxID=796925 RepID=A0A137NW50_CONC2|nr:hypothetical protein CONCODRAFT_19883 [Conidiobolus coronatus NRRL 28638]|eukprot:KXN67033.1 hypothetical protein CONCODRAFT_19883 [Conidiobolus coronatus NRRL 28638]
MQLSNLFISAIVSYISICDANYQVKQPQPTTIVPSYPTQVPSYPVKPPTAGNNNNELYFVCKLNEARKARGLKALAYVSNVKSITDNLVNQYATVGHQQNDLFGSFKDAQCSVSQYVEQYFSGFANLDAVSDSLCGNQDGFLFKNEYDIISFSFNNGFSSVVLAASDKCDAKAVPQCGVAPSQPEQPAEYPVQQPEYPVKQPEYPVKQPETQPTKPAEEPKGYPTKTVEEPKGYPTKPVETKAPQPPKSGVSEAARKSLCLTNKYRRANGKAPLKMSPTLCGTSVRQSISMSNARSLTHNGDNGIQLGDRLKEAGFTWSFAAENIAFNSHDVDAVQKSWETSTYHSENLLSEATCFGYGQNKDSIPEIYYTQNFASPADGQGDCYVDDYSDC